jgi:hypothetical protein
MTQSAAPMPRGKGWITRWTTLCALLLGLGMNLILDR